MVIFCQVKMLGVALAFRHRRSRIRPYGGYWANSMLPSQRARPRFIHQGEPGAPPHPFSPIRLEGEEKKHRSEDRPLQLRAGQAPPLPTTQRQNCAARRFSRANIV